MSEIAALQKKLEVAERRSLFADAALPPPNPPVAPVPSAPPAPPIAALAGPDVVVPAPDTGVPIVVLDLAIDGTRRRQRVAILFALAMVVVLGGLLGSLALSYG